MSAHKQATILFLFHVLLLCGFSLYAFGHNPGGLFIGNDGPYEVAEAYEQLHFSGIAPYLHTNFLEGIGNLSSPINFSVIPAFWFGRYDLANPSIPAMAYTYTWFAIVMFMAVMITGWNYQFPRSICYAAAWLLILLFFPYFPGLGIYSITASSPIHVIIIFAATIMNAGIWRLGRGGWRSDVFCTGLVLTGIMLLLVTMPTHLILIMPFLCVSTFIAFLSAGRTERIRKLSAAAALLLLAVVCGWIEYVAGLLLNTSSGFFIKELMDTYPQDRVYISILFQGKLYGMAMGPWLFIAGFIGAAIIFLFARSGYFRKNALPYLTLILLLSAQVLLVVVGEWFVHWWGGRRGSLVLCYEIWLVVVCFLVAAKIYFSAERHDVPENLPLRPAATVLLSGQALLLATGEWLMHRSGGWNGPALVYYEEPLFALYALFAIFFIAQYIKAIPPRYFAPVRRFFPAMRYTLPVILVAAMTAWIGASPEKPRSNGYYALPPASTSLTVILEREIGTHPGSPFAGKVVSSVPGASFFPQTVYFSALNTLSGNDHQMTGLWLKSIPTLHQDSPLITPEFYSIIHRFLSTPGDLQNRSWTNFSQLDLKILRLLGVRFILTTAPHIETAKERDVLSVSGVPSLHLFELKGSNIAGISANKIVTASSVSEAEDMLSASDLKTAIIINPEHDGLTAHTDTLVAAKDSRISIEKGAYRVRARSDGWTMLILPVEYSRCLDIKALSGALPQSVRVDIALTGLVFYRELDVSVVQQTGPFTHPRCRFRDYLDFRAMAPY